jgi:hypothetical protein
MKTIKAIGLIVCTILALTRHGNAQIPGNGDQGANRRLTTGGSGYGAVSGTFTPPRASLSRTRTEARVSQLSIWELELRILKLMLVINGKTQIST